MITLAALRSELEHLEDRIRMTPERSSRCTGPRRRQRQRLGHAFECW